MSLSSKIGRPIITTALVISSLLILGTSAIAETAAEKSPYMGGDVKLTEAPNGAVVREEVVKTGALISYLEPTTEKLADGVWCIGGYSLANTTVWKIPAIGYRLMNQ